MANNLSVREEGPFVAVRRITEEGEPFFLGISNIIAKYFEDINVTASIIPFDESGLVVYSSPWGFDQHEITGAVPALQEPLQAQYGTFGFMPNQRGGTLLTMLFHSDELIAEQDAIAKHKTTIGELPATAKMNLASVSLGSTLEFPRLNAIALNQTAMDVGIVGTDVTFAPAYYL